MIHISRMSELVQSQAFWAVIESDLWKHMKYFNGFFIIQGINIYWMWNSSSNKGSVILLLYC